MISIISCAVMWFNTKWLMKALKRRCNWQNVNWCFMKMYPRHAWKDVLIWQKALTCYLCNLWLKRLKCSNRSLEKQDRKIMGMVSFLMLLSWLLLNSFYRSKCSSIKPIIWIHIILVALFYSFSFCSYYLYDNLDILYLKHIKTN